MIILGNFSSSSGSIPPAFEPATIVLNGLSLNKSGDNVANSGYDKIVEQGETIDVTLSGTITPNDETNISSRRVEVNMGSRSDLSFSSNTFSVSDNGITEDTTYQAKAAVDNAGSPTIIYSVMRELKFELPVLYGNIDDINQTPANLYTAMSVKMAVQNQDFTLTFPAHASGYHKVICLPDAWGAITSIIKDGQWEQIGSFVTVNKLITKSGAWTDEPYTMYATNLMAAMNEAEYEINF